MPLRRLIFTRRDKPNALITFTHDSCRTAKHQAKIPAPDSAILSDQKNLFTMRNSHLQKQGLKDHVTTSFDR